MSEEITHDPARSRYDLVVDGSLGAYAEYERDDDVIVFTHTVTTPTMRGRGLAGKVVRHALDDARANDRVVIAQCWYVAQYIDQHPEYADLLTKRDTPS